MEKPAFELMGYIELFIKKETQCAFPYVEALVSKISKEFKAIQLIRIGGESIIIKINNNESNEIECLKIARLSIQDPGNNAIKQDKIEKNGKSGENGFFGNIFKKRDDIELRENPNTKIARFMRGCNIHRKILRSMLKDKPDFKVPLIFNASRQPFVYCRQEYLINSSMLKHLASVKTIAGRLFFFVKLLNAIDYIHSYGYIHRDIKIDNLIWDGSKSIVLLDWTLAKDLNENTNLTVDGTEGGTPGIAPAKFLSDGDFGNANFLDDIYELGACLWEFITVGNFPALSKKSSDLEIQKHREEQVKFLPDSLQHIFWKATEPKEDDRYKTVIAMKNDVLKALEFFRDEAIEEKKLDKVNAVIVDTTIEKSYCESCENSLECKNYVLCDLFIKEIKKWKK